jgi:hypothetical protein
VPEPIPHPWLQLLEAAEKVIARSGTEHEGEALLDLAVAVDQIRRMLFEQHTHQDD